MKQSGNEMDVSEFSKEIALALLTAEDARLHAPDDNQTLAHDTYQRLCHDDPVGVTADGCVALQKELLNLESPYALSNQLVDGVQYCCQRYTFQTTNLSTKDATGTPLSNDSVSEPTSTDASEHATSSFSLVLSANDKIDSAQSVSSSYAAIAWTVHVHIPLECFRACDLPTVTRYLGSYIPRTVNADGEHYEPSPAVINTSHQPPAGPIPEASTILRNLSVENRVHIDNNATTDIHAIDAIHGNGNPDNGHERLDEINVQENGDARSEVGSVAEVFAAESDDSDYEYESGYEPVVSIAEFKAWACTMEELRDPAKLSLPTASPSWNRAAESVTQLLQSFTHSQLSALSMSHYQKIRCADHMTQLCLALLVPESSQQSPILTCPQYTSDHWQRLGVHILNIIRDYTLQSLDADDCVLDDYLRLLRILLQVDQSSSTLSPTTWVGLSFLSAISMTVRTRGDLKLLRRNGTLQKVQSCVVDASDDLTDILEKSLNNSAQDVLALQWTYLAFFQLLPLSNSNSQAHPSHISYNGYAQMLLNSGLFRQWLVYWSRTEDVDCRRLIEISILDLCLCSPSLLGKYAWRFPDLTTHVALMDDNDNRTDHDRTSDGPNRSRLVDLFLWNLLGAQLAASENGTPKVKWKAKPPSLDPAQGQPELVLLTPDLCRNAVLKSFQLLCAKTSQILTDWKLRIQHNLPNISDKHSRKTSKQIVVLTEWDRLACALANPNVHSLFLEHVMDKKNNIDARETIQDDLQPIQLLLSQWPVVAKTTTTTARSKADAEDAPVDATVATSKTGDEKTTRTMNYYPFDEGDVLDTLRRAIKIVASIVETSSGERRNQLFSSKAD